MNLKAVLGLLLLAPSAIFAKTYFKETFDSDSWSDKWIQSKSNDGYGAFKVTPGKFYADGAKKAARGLQTSQDAHFYAISAKMDQEFDNEGKDLVLQFSAKFEQNIDCGGGYIKLMPKMEPTDFNGDTSYNIMFGPDICGFDKKIHVIINYKGQNHLIKKKLTPGSDQLTHLYTLIIHPDQTYQVLLDNKAEATGSLTEDWDVLPPAKIPDPDESKPSDWVDDAKIADPEDKKPDGWDDIPEYVVDPDAEKPEDWDDDMDGEWEAPKIKNPDFKGAWKAKMIDNPAYKGVWVHPEIDNPDYVEDKTIYHYNSAYVGFDLWQVKAGTIFDNIIVTDSVAEAKKFADETFNKYQEGEKAAKDKLDEEEKKKAEAEAAKKKAEEDAKKEAEKPEEVEAELDEDEEEEKPKKVEKKKEDKKKAAKEEDHDEL